MSMKWQKNNRNTPAWNGEDFESGAEIHIFYLKSHKTVRKLWIMKQEGMNDIVLAKNYLIIVLDTISSEY